MSYFINQINIFQPKLFINQLNINIHIHIHINSRIEDINNCFRSFKDACEFQGEKEVREKALDVLSRYRSIIEHKREFFQVLPSYSTDSDGLSTIDKFHLYILNTGLMLLSEFNDKSQLFDRDKRIINGLYEDIKNLYSSAVGSYLDETFWYDLQLYEFLMKEKILSNSRWSYEDYTFQFTENNLEEFFSENRSKILKDLYSDREIYSPLHNKRFAIFYDMHKKVMSFTMPVLIE